MTIITRFAPSPTGLLHVGNVRMALINYLLAKQHNGKFILRIDDTDFVRSKKEYEEAIKNDLKWLGLYWDSSFNQLDNLDIYKHYLNILKDKGLIYPCYETKEELEYKRKLQLAKGAPPIYDRSALKLTNKQIQQYENEGRKPYYRFKINPEAITWIDLIKGSINIQGECLSDPVLIKENGVFLYSFCSVVDDIINNITHIIRGEDHICNTAIHLQLFKNLGKEMPTVGHMSLLSMLDGESLSKRKGSGSIKELREKGVHSLAILNYLFMLGQSEQNHVYTKLQDIINDFNLTNYSKGLVKFNNSKLYQINALVLQRLNLEDVLEDLKSLGLNEVTKEGWELYKNNIKSLLELSNCCRVINENKGYKTKRSDLIKIALQNLPTESFTEVNIQNWLNNILKNYPIKKKELFTILREALTGCSTGPSFKDLLLVLGNEKVKSKLESSL